MSISDPPGPAPNPGPTPAPKTKPMKFTDTPPTEPGLYWTKDKDPDEDIEPVEVRTDYTRKLFVIITGTDVRYPLSAFLWGDKIERPEVEVDDA